MSTELKRLRKLIEKDFGNRIDGKTRTRDLSYARAVFCKVAREHLPELYSLQTIGNEINRNHATVMHNIKNVFDHAVSEERFRTMYANLVEYYGADKKAKHETLQSIKSSSQQLKELEFDYRTLQQRYNNLANNNKIINDMIEGLNEEDIKEVYDKLSLFVKAMKSRVYTWQR